MVTGDHPVAAHTFAKSHGIITGPTDEELEEINDIKTISFSKGILKYI